MLQGIPQLLIAHECFPRQLGGVINEVMIVFARGSIPRRQFVVRFLRSKTPTAHGTS